jgi:hypothetical protein
LITFASTNGLLPLNPWAKLDVVKEIKLQSGVLVPVGVLVTVFVFVIVGVRVLVCVLVGVDVSVMVGVLLGVDVFVRVAVVVGVSVEVGVSVGTIGVNGILI